MKFIVNDSFRYDSSGSLDDVIYFVRYCFEESGSSAHDTLLNYASRREFLSLDQATSDDFTEYNSVTTSSIKSWIQNWYGGSWGTYTSSIQTDLTNDLNSRTSDKATGILYWNAGSSSADVEMEASGTIIEHEHLDTPIH